MSLAKVTIVKKRSVKIRHYGLCSGVAAYYVKSIVMCMLCVVQEETALPLPLQYHGVGTALWPTQPPILWLLGALSVRVVRPGYEIDHLILHFVDRASCNDSW